MRLISCLLLCGLLVLAVQGQSCIGLNPFLSEIEKKLPGVRMQSLTNSPQFVNNKCGYEWSKHKTCCFYDKLMEYVAEDRKKTNRFVQEIGDNLWKLKREFDHFKQIMVSASKLEGIMKNTKINKLTSLIRFFNSPESADITLWLSNFGGEQVTRAKTKTCIDKIHSVRSGSVCSICSGRSGRWFQGPKALFSKDNCTPFLADCEYLIKFLGDYGERVQKFFKKLHRVDLSALEVNSKAKNPSKETIFQLAEPLAQIMANITDTEAFELAKEYSKATSNSLLTSKLCNSIVTLVHKPFIANINTLSILIVNYLTRWNQMANILGTTNIVTASNWKFKARMLQFGASPQINLEGDVKVLDVHAKVDSSYGSHPGATGIKGNEASFKNHAIPLNLTAFYP